jgi:glycosyltransferase involved in cell wall biosynthesis
MRSQPKRLGLWLRCLEVSGARLKILTLVDRLTVTGGGERLAIQIACRLDPERFESVLCATRRSESVEADRSGPVARQMLDDAGIRYVNLERHAGWRLDDWTPLYRLLRRERFDVLHAHKFGSNVWGTLVGRLARVPVIVAHEHTWSFEGKPLRRFLDRELIGRGSSVFVAVSEEDRRRMIEIERVRPEKLLFVPNGIEPRSPRGSDVRAELGIPVDAPLIGAVSVLRPQKALDVLVRAVAPLVRERADLRVLIVGEGPEREALTELIESEGVGDRVLLTGFRDDIPDVLDALDVAVSSSAFEGSPLAMMEFMEAARPIVATSVGGVPDLIDDGVHGRLVQAGHVEGLRGALRDMLNDREAARRMGERAQERRRREFDLDVVVRRCEALYERLAAGGGVPSSYTELDAAAARQPAAGVAGT